MSINNQLIIRKNKGHFEVHENLCVDNNFEETDKNLLKKFKTLIMAIKYAQEYCNEYPYVEYGYYITDEALEASA